MANYYENMKEEMGFNRQQKTFEEEIQLDEVLAILAPNTTATNFREFLSKNENFNKSEDWKKIARSVDNKKYKS